VEFHLRMGIKVWIWLLVAVTSSDVHSYGFRAFLTQIPTPLISRRSPVAKFAA
jgi:hypothetical protein